MVNFWIDFEISFGLSSNKLVVLGEKIRNGQWDALLYTAGVSSDSCVDVVQVAYSNSKSANNDQQANCSNRQAIFRQLEGRFEARHIISEVTRSLRTTLQEIVFLNPRPSQMRGYACAYEDVLREDGSNLSAVLYRIAQTEAGAQQLLGFIRILPEQDIAALQFIETERQDVMVRLMETFGAQHRLVDAPLLSDGTLCLLAVGAALLTAPDHSLLVIEGIDSSFDPSRAKLLVEQIHRIADQRRLHVLMTTHNPALLDALPDKVLADVVYCYRDVADGDSRLQRLGAMGRYRELIALGPLGRLMIRGIIDRFVKDRDTPGKLSFGDFRRQVAAVRDYIQRRQGELLFDPKDLVRIEKTLDLILEGQKSDDYLFDANLMAVVADEFQRMFVKRIGSATGSPRKAMRADLKMLLSKIYGIAEDRAVLDWSAIRENLLANSGMAFPAKLHPQINALIRQVINKQGAQFADFQWLQDSIVEALTDRMMENCDAIPSEAEAGMYPYDDFYAEFSRILEALYPESILSDADFRNLFEPWMNGCLEFPNLEQRFKSLSKQLAAQALGSAHAQLKLERSDWVARLRTSKKVRDRYFEVLTQVLEKYLTEEDGEWSRLHGQLIISFAAEFGEFKYLYIKWVSEQLRKCFGRSFSDCRERCQKAYETTFELAALMADLRSRIGILPSP